MNRRSFWKKLVGGSAVAVAAPLALGETFFPFDHTKYRMYLSRGNGWSSGVMDKNGHFRHTTFTGWKQRVDTPEWHAQMLSVDDATGQGVSVSMPEMIVSPYRRGNVVMVMVGLGLPLSATDDEKVALENKATEVLNAELSKRGWA